MTTGCTRYPGQCQWFNNLAVDWKGNVHTTEVDAAQREEKFVNRERS